ncbi:MAG: hypothetical protein JXR37_03190 [Kiritimatiellae bacterium]|nr:hypothetical protein [Kiritimatiellia bacterium]
MALLACGCAPPGRSSVSGPGTAQKYGEAKCLVRAERGKMRRRLALARNAAEKKRVLAQTRHALRELVVDTLIPHWYGTPWSFNGTTQTPRKGKIACGYFVTTVLRDAGLDIDRVRLARAPSEAMIRELIGSEHIRRYSNWPVADFRNAVLKWGAGLYIVGLDTHTGFVFCDGHRVFFIHSAARGVVRQPFGESPEMVASRYRVLGKLSADEALASKWLSDPGG